MRSQARRGSQEQQWAYLQAPGRGSGEEGAAGAAREVGGASWKSPNLQKEDMGHQYPKTASYKQAFLDQ